MLVKILNAHTMPSSLKIVSPAHSAAMHASLIAFVLLAATMAIALSSGAKKNNKVILSGADSY